MRKEIRCHHMGYSFRLAARVLLHAPSHRQDNTYHGFCYTSRGALAGTRNSSMGPPHEGSIRRPIAPSWARIPYFPQYGIAQVTFLEYQPDVDDWGIRGKSVRSWCDGSSDRSFMWWTHWDISRSRQCSTTGVTKAVVCVILSVGWCI